jgi:hypothetical protein
MVYVRIDLHRNRSQIAVLDRDGEQLLSRRIVNEPNAFLELLNGLGDDAQIALEATYGWEWLADLLEEAGCELHLAHPLRTKAIAAAGEDGRGRRPDARASAAHRPAAGGIHRPPRAARPARPAPPPGRAHADALRAQAAGRRDPGQARDRPPLQQPLRARRQPLPRRASATRRAAPHGSTACSP